METVPCTWCNISGELADVDYVRGHNTRRECRTCRERWCTGYPIESYEVVRTFCSKACRARWSRARKCVICDRVLPLEARSDVKTCSVRCRVTLHRKPWLAAIVPT